MPLRPAHGAGRFGKRAINPALAAELREQRELVEPLLIENRALEPA